MMSHIESVNTYMVERRILYAQYSRPQESEAFQI